MKYRMETDSIGSMQIPEDAYYGIHSLRASQNFNITKRQLHPIYIKSLALLKKASAITNMRHNIINETVGEAIIQACDEIIEGKLRDEFIVDVIQGGAGTSSNMNANEVIANRAIELLGGKKGDYQLVHPNDHVNQSQSTNDVIPSAGKLTALYLMKQLFDAMNMLINALDQKSIEFDNVIKMGRTQLQDAVPIRLGQEFHAYATMCRRNLQSMIEVSNKLRSLNMGATAIGTSINATAEYVDDIVDVINQVTNENFRQASDLVDATQNIDEYALISGTLRSTAVSLSKMCNDLRLLSSGPRTGIHEINLPPRQNGSSIMPGKVNPVIPEMVSQVAYQVVGNDVTITLAAEAGQLELNAYEPVIFDNLFASIEMMTNAITSLVDNCILNITANIDRCQQLVEDSTGLVTVLCPIIGYQETSEIVKESLHTGISIRKLILDKGILSSKQIDNMINPRAMTEQSFLSEF